MAACQDWRLSPKRKISVQRRDSDNSPFCRSVCEMLPESSEEEDEGDGSGGNLTYVQQLHRILGHETAEYFLHPPPMEFHISPSLRSILDQMEDTPGAEELWRILQEKSKEKLKEEYGEPISLDKINLLRNITQRPAMQMVSRKRHQLIYIRQLLESQQDQANLLLSTNPFPDVQRADLRQMLVQVVCLSYTMCSPPSAIERASAFDRRHKEEIRLPPSFPGNLP